MDEGKLERSNVLEKLLYVQQHLKAPKGQYNKFGDFHYRSCEDIQEALKPLLEEVKAVVLISDEVVQIGPRFYIRAVASFQDVESAESISNAAYARECESRPKMDEAQLTGACSSYARKYALNGLFCIDDAKDPDALASPSGEGKEKPRQTPAAGNSRPAAGQRKEKVRVQQQHINTIRKEIARTGAQERAVCYQYQIRNLQEMTMEQFKDAMEIFKTMESKDSGQEYQMTLEGLEEFESELPFR